MFLALSVLAAQLSSAALWPDLSASAPEQGGGENDAAVVVGIERYPFVAPVPGAARNAEDWHLHLTKTRKVPVGQVKLLRDNEATLEDLRDAAAWAAGAVKPGGTLWFVFIGHGAPYKDGQDGVLVGVDAQQRAESLYNRSLRRSELMSLLGRGAQERAVVVLDACFSGRGSEGKELVKGLQPLIALSAAAAWPKAAVFTAAKADQFAGPLPGAERPAFSYLLLGALRGWGDADKDGAVTAQEALEYSQGSLEALLKDRRQTPELLGSLPGALSKGARETGPDVGAVVRAVRPAGASELAFGGAAAVSAPAVRMTAVDGGFKSADLAVERLLEDAVLAERDPSRLPAEKMASWCLLAGARQEPHPYREQAAQACASWQEFAAKTHESELNALADYAALSGYLGLRLKTPEQKSSAAAAYLAAYAPLKDHPAVAAVLKAREAVAEGQPAALPPQDEAAPLKRVAEVPQLLKDLAFADCGSYCAEQKACERSEAGACARFSRLFHNPYMTGEAYHRKDVALGLLVCLSGGGEAAPGCRLAAEMFQVHGLPRGEPEAAAALLHGCLVERVDLACVAAGSALARATRGSPGKLDDSLGERGALIAEAACLRGDASSCVFAAAWRRDYGGADGRARARLLLAKACRQKQQASCAELAKLEAKPAPVLAPPPAPPSVERKK